MKYKGSHGEPFFLVRRAWHADSVRYRDVQRSVLPDVHDVAQTGDGEQHRAGHRAGLTRRPNGGRRFVGAEVDAARKRAGIVVAEASEAGLRLGTSQQSRFAAAEVILA